MNMTMSIADQSSLALAITTAQALENDAGKAAGKGEWRQASQLLSLCVQKRGAATGTADLRCAMLMDKLAEAYLRQNKLCDAEVTLSEACQIVEAIYYPEHGLMAPLLEHLADCLIKQGKFAEAAPILKRAEEIYVKTLTMENRATLRSFYKLAKLYMIMAKPAEAKSTLLAAIKYVDTPMGPVAEFRYQLALVNIQLENIFEAGELLKSAVIDFKQHNNCSRAADCLETYAKVCCPPEHNLESDRCLSQAGKYRQQAAQCTYPDDIFLATLLR